MQGTTLADLLKLDYDAHKKHMFHCFPSLENTK